MLPRFIRASIFVVFLISSTALAHAQGVPTSSGIDLTASSEAPTPGQSLTITAESYSADLNSSKVTWTVDGKTAQSGYGLTTLNVTAPAMGKKLNIAVTAITTSGIVLSNSISVSSGSVDMIVETNGYTPPFFKGKLPIVYQNAVTVIAVPHLADPSGAEYDPKTLIYQWKKSSQLLQDQSGYGKQSITLVGNIVPRPYDLSVTVTSRTGNAQAMGIMSVSAGSPTIYFYVDDPLYGPMLNSAIVNSVRIGSQRETGVLAVPFGFNKPQKGLGTVTFDWMINKIDHPELSSNESVVLRAPGDTGGSSDVELNVKDTSNVLQGASGSFSASFGAGSGASTAATAPVTF